MWGVGVPGVRAVGGDTVRLTATAADGRLRAVFADATSGAGGHRFRFRYSAAPGADGFTTVDFHRAQLPPCASADHFSCPFPPPGNRLGLAIEAGERTGA